MDDIIAKKPSSPLGTSLVVITTVALLVAITLAIMTQNREANVDQTIASTINKAQKQFNSKAAELDKILSDVAVDGITRDSKDADTDEEESDG